MRSHDLPLALHKLLVAFAALLLAAGIIVLPWVIVFRLTGPESNFWGMTAILWAPLALLLGIGAGFVFARRVWPRASV
jgi:hypothetical protein